MNLVIFNKLIKKISTAMPLVKNYSTDDIYNDWNTGEKKYAAVNFNIKDVKRQGNMAVYNAILYFADRLTEKKDNRDLIFDDAVFTITAIIEKLKSFDDVVNIDDYDVVLFEQKFADELAGGYANLLIYLADADSACGYDSLIDISDAYKLPDGARLGYSKFIYFDNNIVNIRDIDNLDYMFYNCGNLESVNIPYMPDITNTEYMFYNCRNLTDIQNLNLPAVTDMKYMFYMCGDGKQLNFPKNFTTANVKDFSYSFAWTGNIENLIIDASSSEIFTGMFEGCISPARVKIINSKNVKDTSFMFNSCHSMIFEAPYFDTSGVINADHMFDNCSYMKTTKGYDSEEKTYKDFDFSNVESAKNIFNGCNELQEAGFLNFCKCKEISLNISSFYLKKIECIDVSSAKTVRPLDVTCKPAYMLIKNLGKAQDFSYFDAGKDKNWGDDTIVEDAKKSLIDSLITYSTDRKTAGYPTADIYLHIKLSDILTEEEKEKITNKGYNLLFIDEKNV